MFDSLSYSCLAFCLPNYRQHHPHREIVVAESYAVTVSVFTCHSPEVLLHAKAPHETFFPTELLIGLRSREYCPSCANDETELQRGQVIHPQSLNSTTEHFLLALSNT